MNSSSVGNTHDLARMSAPKARSSPLCFDRRTRAWRTVREFANAMFSEAGGREILPQARVDQIERAAELMAIAKQVRGAVLGGGEADLQLIVRVENAAQRALQGAGEALTRPSPPSILSRVQALQSNPAGPVSPEGDAAPHAVAPPARLDADEGRA